MKNILKGRTVALNTKRQGMWIDQRSGIKLTQFTEESKQTVIPDDDDLDVTGVVQAINMGVLLLIPSKDAPATITSAPVEKPADPGALDTDPKKLVKYSAKVLTNRIIPRLDIDTLTILLNLELQGKSSSGKKRKSVEQAIHRQLKKLGATETQTIDFKEGTVEVSDYSSQKGFKETPDLEVAREAAGLKRIDRYFK